MAILPHQQNAPALVERQDYCRGTVSRDFSRYGVPTRLAHAFNSYVEGSSAIGEALPSNGLRFPAARQKSSSFG
jgi:hypothetical protein